MIVVRRDIPAAYFAANPGARGLDAAAPQYRSWLAIVEEAIWRRPVEVQTSHPKASILKAGRVVFNIKGNDFRLVCQINYLAGTVEIRFFGNHSEHDRIDAELV